MAATQLSWEGWPSKSAKLKCCEKLLQLDVLLIFFSSPSLFPFPQPCSGGVAKKRGDAGCTLGALLPSIPAGDGDPAGHRDRAPQALGR